MSEPICQAIALQLPVEQPGDPIELSLQAGDILLVDGDPQAGRSTLLKVIAGLLSPRSGDLRLFGHSLSNLSQAGLAKQRARLGVLLEHDGLIPSWTALENLMLPLCYRDPDREREHHKRILRDLDVVGEHVSILSKRVSTLTSRQRRRLALVRVISLDAELLLLDDLTNYVGEEELSDANFLSHLIGTDKALVANAPAAWNRYFPAERVASLRLAACHGSGTGVH